MTATSENYSAQKKLTTIIVVLFLIKTAAWYITNSVAILTDTLEYTINVISGFVGLYSLSLSALPKDENHPYGHGKVEFLSAAIEGTLMIVTAFLILYQALVHLSYPHAIKRLDHGIYLVAFTAAVNYLAGCYAVRSGKKNNSLALIGTGRHMQSDTYSTVGIIIGLILLYFLHYSWIDSAVSLVFAMIIIISGYKIIRSSIAGIMDEADEALLKKVVDYLQASRRENWIDLHNLRIIKYGGTLHLDCHMTVPWYLNVHQAHEEIDALSKLIRENFGESVELFVHTDGCLDFSCKICTKQDCSVRKHPFVKKIDWTVENISTNSKHKAD